MARLRKNVAPLLDRAIESITLAVELFNRPSEAGRVHGVLILLQHCFEMLLKASILQKTGVIHDPDNRYTYGFDRCLRICHEELGILTKDESATLAILDAQRDQASHYYLEISEELLYVHAQSSVTLFETVLRKQFGASLASRLPPRVLPVSTRPPTDIEALFASELTEVDRLLEAGRRQGARAAARLRSILAFTAGARGEAERVTEAELERAITQRRRNKPWELILPEVAQMRLDTAGSGVPVTMRIGRDAPVAVRVAQPGEPVSGTLVKQEVNLWDVFTMSRDDLANKLSLSGPRTHALIYELKLQEDPQCYREIKKKSQVFKGYSKKALDKLRDAKATVDLEVVWLRHKHRFGAGKRAG